MFGKVWSLAAGGLAALVLSIGSASAITAVPLPGGPNLISLHDVFTAEFNLNVGNWTGANPDVGFGFMATEPLTAVTTDTLNPPTGSISNLSVEWNTMANGSGASLASLVLTNAAGTLINPLASLTFIFPNTTDVFYLLVSADGVLRNSTNFDLRVEAVPVPPALLLFGSALAGLGFLSRRRKKSHA